MEFASEFVYVDQAKEVEVFDESMCTSDEVHPVSLNQIHESCGFY